MRAQWTQWLLNPPPHTLPLNYYNNSSLGCCRYIGRRRLLLLTKPSSSPTSTVFRRTDEARVQRSTQCKCSSSGKRKRRHPKIYHCRLVAVVGQRRRLSQVFVGASEHKTRSGSPTAAAAAASTKYWLLTSKCCLAAVVVAEAEAE